jgi:transposase, IS5 family
LYTLSDDQNRVPLKDRLSFMRFVGLALHNRTIFLRRRDDLALPYREQLARAGAAKKLFARFDTLLGAKGWLAMGREERRVIGVA